MEKAKYIVRMLQEAGYECFLVGGCVRDFVLGLSPKDRDLATNAPFETLQTLFKTQGVKFILTGAKHGTMTVFWDGESFELSSYRSAEGRPTTKEEDALHRDFTMNCLYQDAESGEIFDPYQGRYDIERRLIKAVESPQARIQEDPLRVLRAFRFMSQLGFALEKETLDVCLSEFETCLKSVSPERLRDEFMKLLAGPKLGFLLQTVPNFFDLFFKQKKGKDATRLIKVPSSKPFLRMVLALDNYSAPFFLDHYKFSNLEKKTVLFLLKKLSFFKEEHSLKEIKMLVREAGLSFGEKALALLEDLSLLWEIQEGQGSTSYQLLKRELTEGRLVYESPLSGVELQELFEVQEGKVIGLLKEFLIEQLLEGNLAPQDKDKALQLAREYYKKAF